MRLMRFAVLGAAVAGGILYYLNNRSKANSILDDIKDNAGDWTDKARDIAGEYLDKLKANLS